MHQEFPRVAPGAGLVEALGAMTRGKLGMTTIMEGDQLLGIISDGDVRRALERAQATGQNPLGLAVREIMTPRPVTVEADTFAIEAARILEARKITFVLVMDGDRPAGILHIHDLLGAKVI